jgi:excisionase family DNA binding protein
MKDFMSTGEAALLLGIQKETLDVWRARGKGPAFFKIGRSVKYNLADVKRFINEARNTNKKGAGK